MCYKNIKKTLTILVFFLFITNHGFTGEVKKADLAGTWYPSDLGKLTSMLQGYLDAANLKDLPSHIIAIIAPHAGYIYSGRVAAYSFKAVSNMDVNTVVIVGFSHRRCYDAISVYDRGSFDTPFGPLDVDADFARKLIASNEKFYFSPAAFDGENSVEMMLPFIKYIFKDVKIVPIAIGNQSYSNIEILSSSLYNLLKDKKKYLLIASTDMSHYHNYGEANAMDSLAISALKKFDYKGFYDKVSFEKCEACGVGAVAATMMAAEKLGADSLKVLKYANSGDTTGQKNRVVGYLSAVIYKSPGPGRRARLQNKEVADMLNKTEKKRLLQIARDTITSYIKTGKAPDFKEDDSILNKELGAFVTIHKNGQLRGCIGNIIGQGPLYLTVKDMAIEASTQDRRFSPVEPTELNDIDIEISVLSKLKRVTDPKEIVMGMHGVIIRNGFRSGVFLPQVATETGWSRDEFMSNLCAQKAGLPPDAWKKGDADIFVFTAQVFGEKE